MEREEPVLSALNQINHDEALERFMLQQKRHASTPMLPKPEVPIFDGDPIEYQTFVRAFENLIEANTDSDSTRLYYLIQYTRGDVKELMKSCLSMKNEEGYLEAGKTTKLLCRILNALSTAHQSNQKMLQLFNGFLSS